MTENTLDHKATASRNAGDAFFNVDQRRFESFRFDFYKNYNWLNYDDVCKQFEELKKQEFKYGVWADIYATF